MDKKSLSHASFLDRLSDLIAPHLGLNKYDRGFRRALARALDARDSTIQRWFNGSYPEAGYLIKIHQKFGISPNQLLGIEPRAQCSQSLNLHKIQFIAGARTKQLPDELLDPEFYSVGPILRDSRSACHPESIDEKDIDSWGITRKDLVLQRNSVYAIIVPERIGMSMWPIIKPGDLMVLDCEDRVIVDGGIFAFRNNGSFIVRQVKKTGSTNSIVLIPWFLREYTVETLDLDTNPDAIIGRVIFSITYLTKLAQYKHSGEEMQWEPSHLASQSKS